MKKSKLKTATITTADLIVTLQVGKIEEMVEIEGGSEIVERSSNAIGATVRGDSIRALPLNNRNTLGFVLLVPGAQQIGTVRGGTFLGLPQGAINITMDGLNIQGSVGHIIFATVQPRLDAVEEVTVTTAAASANLTTDGAVQIQFVTRRGTNTFRGTLFWDHRNEALNANTWFNNALGLPRLRNLLNVFGGNVGGPIWKNKLFFFFNDEEFRWPQSVSRENLILTREAASGVFRYRATDGSERTANLLQFAGAVGFPSAIDPTVGDMLRRIDGGRGRGAVSALDLFRERYRFQSSAQDSRRFPVLWLDYQITDKLHWQGVTHYNHSSVFPDTLNQMDPTFPGIGKAAGQYTSRYAVTTALQWAIIPTLGNEFRFGAQPSRVQFWPESGPEIYPTGLRVLWPLSVQSLHARPASPNSSRVLPGNNNQVVYNLQDNVSWLRGNHNWGFGGGVSIGSLFSSGIDLPRRSAGIPDVTLNFRQGDPVSTTLSAANLPGISNADIGNALSLYALLTGRISAVSGNRNVDEKSKQYLNSAPLVQRIRGRAVNVYFQDSWCALPNLTLNYGLGWQFAGAAENTNDIFTGPTFEDLWGVSGVGNLFRPGVLNGGANPQIYLRPKNLYHSDFVNPAPSFGLAWSPRFERSTLKRIFGAEGKSVFRGGYSISYTSGDLNNFSTFAGGSPGLTQSITLTGGTDFAAGSLLLRNPLPAFQEFPKSFSFPASQSQFTFAGLFFRTFDPNIRSPYVQSWSFGWQRELTKNMAIEARYVGNHGTRLFRTVEINDSQVNIFENGFLSEFKNAQRNLQINQTAGVNSFANLGRAGQAPLPIFEAAFGARGGQPALPANQGFTNGGFITLLNQGQAGALADSLAWTANYLCRMTGHRLAACAARGFNTAGPFAPNFFQVNPDAANDVVQYLSNGSSSTHHGLQLELRRRLSQGLMLDAHYTFSKSLSDLSTDSAFTLRNPGLNKGPTPSDLRHTFVARWVYELPFGSGHKWTISSVAANKLIEGWNLLGIVRLQSGRAFRLTSGRQTVNSSDAGVILRGITTRELQQMIRVRKEPGAQFVFFVAPELIGPDGQSNRAILDVPTTPGEFGAFVYLYGPRFVKPDLTVIKKTRVTERVNVELWAEFFNAFNYQNFFVGTTNIDSTTFGRTTNFFNDRADSQDPGPRMIQFRFRVNF